MVPSWSHLGFTPNSPPTSILFAGNRTQSSPSTNPRPRGQVFEAVMALLQEAAPLAKPSTNPPPPPPSPRPRGQVFGAVMALLQEAAPLAEPSTDPPPPPSSCPLVRCSGR